MNILGKAEDPKFWTDVVRTSDAFADYRRECVDYWTKNDLEHKNFNVLKYSDYKLYWTTGDRDVYQGQYFPRRAALEYTLPLALMYPEEEKYVEKIMDWVFMICDEYSWCLPAHQGVLEQNNNTRIDLFAAESGLWLAMIDRLLGDRIDPLIRNRIAYETDRRIISPFLAKENYGWWEGGHMNWTAVCMCGVAGTIMIMRPDLVDDKLIDRFNRSMNAFIDGFKDDGICLEGCGYWGYGVGFFVQYADMVRNFTDGKIDLFRHPRMKAIATFPQRMFLSDDAAVSFADGQRVLRYQIGVLHRFKTEFPDDVLIYSSKYGTYGQGCGRMGCRIFAAAWMVDEYFNNPADSSAEFESYAADSQWYVKRTKSYGFAAKAGNNNEFHNHNDVGSFIFAKGGRQLLMDLGSGKYTRQYFERETRYGFLECSSAGHSLPIFNGENQRFGREWAAKDVSFENGSFSMDIAGAYGLDFVSSAKRTFTCEAEEVTLTDRFTVVDGTEIVERVVTTVEPKELGAGKLSVGEAELTYDASICTLKVTETEGTAQAKNAKIYLIDFKLNDGVKEFSLVVR